jgi:hypothetical protein
MKMMVDNILAGRSTHMMLQPREQWEALLCEVPLGMKTRLAFMSTEHHLVRNFVVSELPSAKEPITSTLISQRLHLSLNRVKAIVDDLQRNLFFLVQDEQEAISWAFPFTIDPTPHRLTFSTGEHVYAA